MNVNMKHTSKHLQFLRIEQKFSQNHHVFWDYVVMVNKFAYLSNFIGTTKIPRK
jgi:hypothetical protein